MVYHNSRITAYAEPDSLPLLRQLWNECKGRLSRPVSPDNSDLNGFVEAVSAARTPLSHVALNSPADVSTLSDITNTPPMHAPESEERFDVQILGKGRCQGLNCEGAHRCHSLERVVCNNFGVVVIILCSFYVKSIVNY